MSRTQEAYRHGAEAAATDLECCELAPAEYHRHPMTLASWLEGYSEGWKKRLTLAHKPQSDQQVRTALYNLGRILAGKGGAA